MFRNDKETLANLGINMAIQFCDVNKIKHPELNIIRDETDPECIKIKRLGTCGYYRRNKIYVAVPACAHQNPNYSWAGFISDRTPYGVIQHELGHYVDEIKSGVDIYRTRNARFFSDEIRELSGERPITSYAPNNSEWFAEIFRLFVTNPFLLRQIRPKAYYAITTIGDMIPIVGTTSKETLEIMGAPERVYERMNNWIQTKK